MQLWRLEGSWRRGPAAGPQGSSERRITPEHPSMRWVLALESTTQASKESFLLPSR